MRFLRVMKINFESNGETRKQYITILTNTISGSRYKQTNSSHKYLLKNIDGKVLLKQ